MNLQYLNNPIKFLLPLSLEEEEFKFQEKLNKILHSLAKEKMKDEGIKECKQIIFLDEGIRIEY